MEKVKNNKIHFAWIVLLGLCIIRSLSFSGLNNVGSMFFKVVSEDIGVGIGSLSVQFSISAIVSLVSMPFAAKLLNKYNAKFVILSSIILQAGGFIAMGFMNNIIGWYVVAIPMGIGGAILMNLVGPILIYRWFSKHTGLAIGILMAAGGIVGAILQPTTANLITNLGWRSSYITIGVACLIVIALSALLFVVDNPNKTNSTPLGFGENGKKISEDNFGVDVKTARKSPAFVFLFIFLGAITAFAAFQIHLTTYGLQLGFDLKTVGVALSGYAIGSAIGSISIGILSDKIGAYKTSLFMVFMGVISISMLFISSASIGAFMVGTFLQGFAASSINVLAPLLTRTFFGTKDYANIFSNVILAPSVASIAIIPLYGYIYDIFGNYNLVIGMLFAIMGICFVTLVLGFKSSKKLLNNNKNNEEKDDFSIKNVVISK